jgi:signal transduction histidine kinase
MDLSFLEKQLPKGQGSEQATARLTALSEMIKETVKTVRRISSELRPSILDDLGLAAALEWLGRDFEARTGLKCAVSVPGTIELPPQKAIVVFRMCQEALTNVARHAQATQVSIDLVEAEDQLTLEVHDNGRGIGEQELQSHVAFGLLGMRERAALLGGTVTITGQPGKGTSVVVQVPLKD